MNGSEFVEKLVESLCENSEPPMVTGEWVGRSDVVVGVDQHKIGCAMDYSRYNYGAVGAGTTRETQVTESFVLREALAGAGHESRRVAVMGAARRWKRISMSERALFTAYFNAWSRPLWEPEALHSQGFRASVVRFADLWTGQPPWRAR